MKVGFVNTFIDIIILQLAINTWGYAYFDLGHWPEWARAAANTTMEATTTLPVTLAEATTQLLTTVSP